VTPPSRLVWTNDEGDEGGAVTTATFEEKRVRDARRYARPLSIKKGSERCNRLWKYKWAGEQLEQLDQLLVTLEPGVETVMKSSNSRADGQTFVPGLKFRK
jgi:hypothetical protein